MTRLVAGSATDVGLVRAVNQDHMLVAEPLFAVADGMGGHAAGEVASETALDALLGAIGAEPPEGGWTAAELGDAVRAANRAVWEEAQANPDFRGMGTTLTALALIRDGGVDRLAVANVGDSRTYRLRGEQFQQLTIDHSLVAELVAEGQIRPDEAETHPQRHVLTRALGVYPEVEVDVLLTDLQLGDRFVLCSDGLSREVSDAQIASVLRRLADATDAARELVAMAKLHGGSDNVTVVVVDVAEGDRPGGDIAAGAALQTGDGDAARTGGPDGADGGAGAGEPGGRAQPATVTIPTAAGGAPDDTLAVDLAGVRALLDEHPAPTDPAAAPAAPPAGNGTSDEEAPPKQRRLRQPRRVQRVAVGPRNRIVTVRVVVWFVALLAVLGAAYGGADWYEHAGYYVGLQSGRITIYHGRVGGLLWWRPSVVEVTGLRTSDVLSVNLNALHAGVQESSLPAARAYVRNLHRGAVTAGLGSGSAGSSAPAGALAAGPGRGLL